MMTLVTQIEYRTSWGEEIRVVGSVPELGGGDIVKACPLTTSDGVIWAFSKDISVPASGNIEYRYILFKSGMPVRKEWNAFPRVITGCKNGITYRCCDSWKGLPPQQLFFSSAYIDCWSRCKMSKPVTHRYNRSLIIKVYAPRIGKECVLCISGNQDSLGNWDIQKVAKMNNAAFPEWTVELNAANLIFPIEYKFLIYNTKNDEVVEWENTYNRTINDLQIKSKETVCISDLYANFNLPLWKVAGTAIPVFSLRSNESFGIGDFDDLKKMISWVSRTDQKILQILPINDTSITNTWTDSYPYSAISIYALHPLYMSLGKLGLLRNKKQAEYFSRKQKELNALKQLDYEAVNKLKWEYFSLVFKQDGENVLNSVEYQQFFTANEDWLQSYAVFCVLRDKYKTANFRDWETLSEYDSKEVERLSSPKSSIYKQIELIYYVQYNLHKQLSEASEYAVEHGVALKGDIPIGINRNSVEAWTEPHYFNLNGQAGAPPDDFSVNGQNWGFPTYNWDVMSKDGYKWWMKRFQKMAQYFHAYRIDHILGFFRIWEIPIDAVHGLLGQFSPALPMSKTEIEQRGLFFKEDLFTKPYIREYFLADVFGNHTDEVKEKFLARDGDSDAYHLKPQFDTQKKVEAYFADKMDADNVWIRDGLYSLISDVLFLRDHKNPNLYHPRISAQFEYAYKMLSQYDKDAFNRIYDHYYYYRHNEFWKDQAMKKLPQLIQSTHMLVCGEDLGMIPTCVNEVMDQLQILSLEVQRMPKQRNCEFGWPGNYPFLSVCTISSHDTSTLRGWWEEDRNRTQRYFNNILGRQGMAPEHATPDICEQVIYQHLSSSSSLCILTFQDWLSIDANMRNDDIEGERINVPANPHHYWRYRIHITLEDLLKADDLNNKICELIHSAYRDREF
jgi:4-alpha-glucanotransferase